MGRSFCKNCTHTHPFNCPLSRTSRVSRYQKDKTNLDFTEARDSEWQWHQLCCMQVCTSLQTDNHTSTPPIRFLQAGCPSCRPNQQRQSTEGTSVKTVLRRNVVHDEGFGAGVKTTRACVCVVAGRRSLGVGRRSLLSELVALGHLQRQRQSRRAGVACRLPSVGDSHQPALQQEQAVRAADVGRRRQSCCVH